MTTLAIQGDNGLRICVACVLSLFFLSDTCLGDLLGSTRTPEIQRVASEQIAFHVHREAFGDAVRSYKSGELEGCLVKLTKLVELDPTLPTPKLVLVWLLLSDQRMVEAKTNLEALAALTPHDAEVVKTLGQVALAEGRWADAAAQFEKAAVLRLPSSWPNERQNTFASELLDSLSIVYQSQARWSDSIAVLSRLLVLQPNHPSYRIRMARSYYQLGQFDKVAPLLEQASSKTGGAVPAELLWAEIAFACSNYEDTVSRIETAISVHPTNATVQLWYAEFLLFQRDFSNARKAVESARLYGDDSFKRLMLDGQCKFGLELYLQAAADFREAVQQLKELKDDRNRIDAESWYAMALLMIGGEANEQLAKEVSQSLAMANPTNPMLLSRLGWIHLREKKLEEARLLLERAILIAGNTWSNSHSEIVFFWAQYCATPGEGIDPSDSEARTKAFDLLEGVLATKRGMFFFESEARRLLEIARSK